MDTSEEYIKMCEKAQEVQEFCILRHKDSIATKEVRYHLILGDIWVNPKFKSRKRGKEIDGYYINLYDDEMGIASYDCIWLPRQDQLQEMIIDKYKDEDYSIYKMLEHLYNTEGDLDYSPQDRSLEQAWLAFIMKEKYNKQWNNSLEQWEIIN